MTEGGGVSTRSVLPTPQAVAELVRLPAVLSVPGDVLLGAAASGQHRDLRRAGGLAAASSCLYLAGMALNDYVDRDVDARERPGRPIPSGRVTPGFALGLAGGLTAASTALALAADGPRALAVAGPLAGAVWAYDLALKQTPAGPGGMSACRALDVLMGAGPHGARRALAAAGVVGAHTAVVTSVSRSEAHGATPGVGRAALAATAGVAGAAALVAGRGAGSNGTAGPRPVRSAGVGRRLRRFAAAGPRLSRSDLVGAGLRRAAALGLLGAYAAAVGRAHADAARDPSPERLQRAVGVGVLGLMPLEAGLLAGAGALIPAGGVAALWPLARSLARRRSVT